MAGKIKVRVGVAYNNQGAIHYKCQESLDVLLKEPQIDVELMKVKGCLIGHIRNSVVSQDDRRVKQPEDKSYDYVLFVDSDIAFRPEHVLKLLSHQKPIVGGAYTYRLDPSRICSGKDTTKEFDGLFTPNVFLPKTLTGLQEVDFNGCGFLLIHRDVFKQIEYPWFREVQIPFKDDKGQDSISVSGEDVGFFLQTKKAKIPSFVDMDCQVEHIMDNVQYLGSSVEDMLNWSLTRRDDFVGQINHIRQQLKEQEIMAYRLEGAVSYINDMERIIKEKK